MRGMILSTAAASVFAPQCRDQPLGARVASTVRLGLALSDLLYFGPLVMLVATSKRALSPEMRALLWRGGAFAALGGAAVIAVEAQRGGATCPR